MTQIFTTASYIKNRAVLTESTRRQVLDSILHDNDLCASDSSERIWELLETPQTVKTLCRALSGDAPADPACIESLLARLYDEDLIQASPDT